jgi:hypothetical protein
MVKIKALSTEEIKKINGGTPGGLDFISGGPHVARDVLNAIKDYFK